MHTNNTSHYNLPQFIGSDIPNPLTDWNDSMQDIDTAMFEIKTQADEIGSDIVQDESDISDLQSQANLTDDNITLLNQQTTEARSAATDAQDAANRNAANITTLQQSVANNRTSITQYNNRFNQNVPFAFGIEEVEDPDNPGQTIEAYGFYTNDDPAEFVPFGESAKGQILAEYDLATGSGSGSYTIDEISPSSMMNYGSGFYIASNDMIINNTGFVAQKNMKVKVLLFISSAGSALDFRFVLNGVDQTLTPSTDNTIKNGNIYEGEYNLHTNDILGIRNAAAGSGAIGRCGITIYGA